VISYNSVSESLSSLSYCCNFCSTCSNILPKIFISTVKLFCSLFVVKWRRVENGPRFYSLPVSFIIVLFKFIQGFFFGVCVHVAGGGCTFQHVLHTEILWLILVQGAVRNLCFVFVIYLHFFMGITTVLLNSLQILDHILLAATVSVNTLQHHSWFKNGRGKCAVEKNDHFWLQKVSSELAFMTICWKCMVKLL
jgi:hypothetical protein